MLVTREPRGEPGAAVQMISTHPTVTKASRRFGGHALGPVTAWRTLERSPRGGGLAEANHDDSKGERSPRSERAIRVRLSFHLR